ncbi:MAG TPA: hypothetical protein VGS79_18245 [Puia sp.]|nr:hypothetical protein [Puia sp.]
MKTIFLLLLLTGSTRLWAQRDTLAPFRKFVHICSDYRQLPVQLEMDLRSSSNLVLSAADTARLTARLALCQKGSYVTMDGMEQLANDSFLLVVNPKTKRMLLYPNHQSVAARLQFLGRQLRDSSVPQLAAKYLVKKEKKLRDTSIIVLESRADLPYTSVPAGQMEVSYESVTQRPYTVTMVERRLIPVSDSIYKSVAGRPEWIGKTVSVKDSSFFLIREQTRVVCFRKIGHQQATDPPVRISDRIALDLTGVYRPVKDFAAFRLIQQAQ